MKTIAISAKGIQNLNNFPNFDNDFTFYFSSINSFKMKILNSEFISPKVSQLRQTDPTIQEIHFDYNSNNLQEYFSSDIISFLKNLSIGNSIDIDQSQGFKLLIISILLENPELFKVISDAFQIEINDSNLDQYIHLLIHLYQFSQSMQYYNYNNIIDYISANFHRIDKSKLLPLPKSILFLIISNNKLKLYNEDSLFDFIQQIFETDENDSELNKNNFLEKVNFLRLSQEKLNDVFQFN